MAKRILLVTGGLGFIGERLLPRITQQYDQTIVVDSLNTYVHSKVPAVNENIRVIVGKVEDPRTWDFVRESINSHVEYIDVCHLASETSTGLSLKHPTWHVTPNVTGTALLMEFLDSLKIRIRRVVLSSSRAVYGEGAWKLGDKVVYPTTREKSDLDQANWNPRYNGDICEEPIPSSSSITFPNPCNIYGVSKLAQEQLLKTWGTSHHISVINLRFQNVYGPGQALENGYSGILAFFVKQMIFKHRVPIYEGGNILRDFVYVDDVVDSLGAALMHKTDSSFTGDVGTGRSISLAEAAFEISKITNCEIPELVQDYRPGDVRAAFCDPRETQIFLGVTCNTSTSKGFEALVDWAQDKLEAYKTTNA
jgi:dTDP-L-rhamnose 4-epimerase